MTLGYDHMSDVVGKKDGTTVKLQFRGSLSGGLIQDKDGVLSYLGDHDVQLEASIDGGQMSPVSSNSGGYAADHEWDDLDCTSSQLTAKVPESPVSWHFKRAGKVKKSIARAASVPGIKDPCKLVSEAQMHAATGVTVGRGRLTQDLGPTPICQFALRGVAPGGQTDAVQINDFAYNAYPSTLKSTLGPHYKHVKIDRRNGLCGVKTVASNAPLEGTLMLSAPDGDSLEVVADATDRRNACSIAEKIGGDAARHF